MLKRKTTELEAVGSKDRERWRGKPLEARLDALEAIFVVHRDVHKVLHYIEIELPHRKAAGKSCGALIIASTGSGKTTLIDYLARLYPDEVQQTITYRRVVAFKVPKAVTTKALGRALLKALGDPLYDAGDAESKLERIADLLKSCGTVIVALDDFQDVPARRKRRGIKDVGDWIRDLCEMKFPGIFLAFGTEDAAVVRDSNDQLLRRMQSRLELRSFSLDGDVEIARFRELLDLIDAALPLAGSSKLSSPALVARIFFATNGNFDYLIKLLGKAIAHAVSRGAEHLELVDLMLGFADQHQVAAIYGNPFDPKYVGGELTQPGQVFHVASAEEEEIAAC